MPDRIAHFTHSSSSGHNHSGNSLGDTKTFKLLATPGVRLIKPFSCNRFTIECTLGGEIPKKC